MVNKKTLNNCFEYLRIRFNNISAILLFVFLKQFFRKKNNEEGNVLFVNLGLLGDIIISTVISKNDRNLIQKFSNVYLLFDKKYSGLFDNYKSEIKILFLDLDKYRINLFYRINYLKQIRKLKIYKTFNLSFCRRTIDDELVLLNGSDICYGFDNVPKILKLFSNYIDSIYTEIIKPYTGNHFSDTLTLLKYFSPNITDNGTIDFKLNKLPSELNNILSKNKKRIVAIAPFTSRAIKNWNSEKYAELTDHLVKEYDALIIILNDNSVNDFLKQNDNPQIINLSGKTTLTEAASVIAISNLFIGNDSGLFHIAKSNNIPRIGLVGGGAFDIIYPYGSNEQEILLYKKMSCFGCHWNCIYDQAYCLQDIDVLTVLDSVKLLFDDEKIRK